jgi:DNA-binding transcriptional ArsR family regulator
MGGCWLGECHYVTEGNYDAISMMHLTRKLLGEIGIDPERLRLEWVSASEGVRFAEVMTDFSTKLKSLGPLGFSEGMDETRIKFELEAATNIIPYVKLVERHILRVHFETTEEYKEYFASDELDRLFQKSVSEKLTMSRITLLLREKPLTTGEISDALSLNPSEVARQLFDATRQGLVRFDESQKSFAPA